MYYMPNKKYLQVNKLHSSAVVVLYKYIFNLVSPKEDSI